jgi:hypothetical protein
MMPSQLLFDSDRQHFGQFSTAKVPVFSQLQAAMD